MKSAFFTTCLALAVLLGTPAAQAFKLKVVENKTDLSHIRHDTSRARELLAKFGDPVHEEITMSMFGCTYGAPCELDLAHIDTATLQRGIRWPDNPAFYISVSRTHTISDQCLSKKGRVIMKLGESRDVTAEQTLICWALTMAAAQRAATEVDRTVWWGNRRNSSFALPLRSHYGDYQFFHAMAPNGQRASETYGLVMAWAELTYDVARGRIKAGDRVASVVNSRPTLHPLRDYFHPKWSIADLFDFSDPNSEEARGIALGALLHMIEDSYAECHTTRSDDGNGAIEQYLTYFGQDSVEHGKRDTRSYADHVKAKLLDHGRFIVAALRANDEFQNVRDYLDQVLKPTQNALKHVKAAPGACEKNAPG